METGGRLVAMQPGPGKSIVRWGGKRGAAPKNPYPVQGIAVQAVPFLNSEAFRLHQNFFRKKGVKKFARKEKGYTFAAANEVKRSNPSGLEKRRRGH